MADLFFVLLLVVLFAATAGFVKVCDRMLGSDDEALGGASVVTRDEPDARIAA